MMLPLQTVTHPFQDSHALTLSESKRYWAIASDEELCEIIAATSSQEALKEVIDRYGSMVRSLLARLLKDSNDRDDVFQVTFVVLFLSISKIRRRSSLGSYVYGIAYRSARRLLQSRSRHSVALETVPWNLDEIAEDEPLSPFTRMVKELHLTILDEELHSLPDSVRGPILDHYIMGRSVPQIAESMRLSVSAVEGRIKRGKQQLRSKLALRGVSLSAAMAALQMVNQAVQAADSTNGFQEAFNRSDSTLNLIAKSDTRISLSFLSSSLQQLVQGELAMRWSNRFLQIMAAGGVCGGLLIGLSVIPNTTPSASHSFISSAHAVEAVASPTVLVQPSEPDEPFAKKGEKQDRVVASDDSQGTTSSEAWSPSGPPPKWLTQGNSGDRSKDGALQMKEKLASTLVEVDFNSIPLKTVVRRLADEIGADILLYEREMVETSEPVSVDEPITLQLSKKLPAKQALEMILDPLGLAANYDEYMVTIYPIGALPLQLDSYDLSFVLPDDRTIPELISCIEQNALNTPPFAEGTSVHVLGSMLIVNASQIQHEKIEKILQCVAKQNRKHIKPSNLQKTAQPSYQDFGGGMGMGGMGGGMGGMGGGMGGMGGGMGGMGGGMF